MCHNKHSVSLKCSVCSALAHRLCFHLFMSHNNHQPQSSKASHHTSFHKNSHNEPLLHTTSQLPKFNARKRISFLPTPSLTHSQLLQSTNSTAPSSERTLNKQANAWIFLYAVLWLLSWLALTCWLYILSRLHSRLRRYIDRATSPPTEP